jgi:hypothetical protein
MTLVAVSRIGLPGLLVGGILAVSAISLPPEYTFALGQFALVMLVPELPSLAGGIEVSHTLLGVGEAGLVAMLVAPPADGSRPPAAVATTLAAGATAIGILMGWMSVHWLDSIRVSLLVYGVLAALIGLGIREYEYWVPDPPTGERRSDHE